MSVKGLKRGAIISFVVAILILLIGGFFAKDKVPPIPEKVVSNGKVLFTKNDIMKGQATYQQYGLMDHGSVWGHGALRGMDFSAHTLHLLGVYMREFYAKEKYNKPYDSLSKEDKAKIDGIVVNEIKTNRYDGQSKTLTLTPAEAYAFNKILSDWEKMFKNGNKDYGFLPNTVKTPEERKAIGEFFFWTAWAAGTNRPGIDYTYTNNWPPDKSVGNSSSSEILLWTVFSILALFLILGLVVYLIHRYKLFYGEAKSVDAALKLFNAELTPSQRASAKFFLLAGVLFIAQIFNGGLLAHYTVHPGSFYIKEIAELIPYSLAKTWHLQLAILWIAISWVGTAIFLSPLIAGHEPKGQKLLVNLLFVAVVIVGVGSLLGEAFGISGKLKDLWFWFGHQGWEYLELGRIWQILLFVGLIFWLFIVYRPLASFLSQKKEGEDFEHKKGLVIFYVISAILVVAFFGFGLFYSPSTHLTVADYWRWYVVHIWVEGIFEFFGVAVIALFFVSMGLATPKSALKTAYFTAILVFISGIPGTAHHYFWYGGPSFWLAIGGVFSSLEPIPLITLVARAWMEYKSIKDAGEEFPYKWPLYFLTASSFWNFLGAGVFGFLINLPIVNYYEHGTYLTANHGHTALFGVYGMLAIALILFSWRGLVSKEKWNDKILKISFWGLNGGLFLMFSTSLLPVGILQIWHSFKTGTWFAKSAEFFKIGIVETFGTWRLIPDLIIILVGAFPLLWFLLSTVTHMKKSSK